MKVRNSYTFITDSPAETERVGRRVGKALAQSKSRAFVAMYGDLGAGKTVFVRGLASVLSPGSRVKSPTYTLVNEYRRGTIPLFHFDLYRVGGSEDLLGIGFDDFLAEGICVAEWSENLGGELPPDAVLVRMEKLGENERRITVEGTTLEEENAE